MSLPSVLAAKPAFALNLYQQLQKKPGNLFFSPYSLSIALAMTYAGARERTASQMERVLRFDLSGQELFNGFTELQTHLERLRAQSACVLNLANSIWPHDSYSFRQDFIDLLRNSFGVTITPVDYILHREEARLAINGWVQDETGQKISELIQEGVLTRLTRLVLTNAIYFKANWAEQFDPLLTRIAPFRISPRKYQEVKMMNRIGHYGYAQFLWGKLIEIPYFGDDLSFVGLLPDQAGALVELQQSLSPEQLNRWINLLERHEVEVSLPRFRLSSSFRLENTLADMGMPDAFDPMLADFSGMADDPVGLFISAAIHQAFIEVNEEGSEASAATAIVMDLRALPAPRLKFTADHPFIFLIRDRRSGLILFIGRFAGPEA